MANDLDHIALANKNHDLLLHLLPDVDKFPEWTATVAFYKAVHVVEAVFYCHSGFHSTSHFVREKRLKLPQFKSIFKDYKHLLTASRIARYLADREGESFKAFTDFMDPSIVRDKLVKKRLFAIEQKSMVFLSNGSKELLKKLDTTKI